MVHGWNTSSSRASRRRKFPIRRNGPIGVSTFSPTCASSSQTHALRTFDPRGFHVCQVCVPPARDDTHPATTTLRRYDRLPRHGSLVSMGWRLMLLPSDQENIIGTAACSQTLRGPWMEYKQFPGKPAAKVSYKKKWTDRSVHVLSNMRVLHSNARTPDF